MRIAHFGTTWNDSGCVFEGVLSRLSFLKGVKENWAIANPYAETAVCLDNRCHGVVEANVRRWRVQSQAEWPGFTREGRFGLKPQGSNGSNPERVAQEPGRVATVRGTNRLR